MDKQFLPMKILKNLIKDGSSQSSTMMEITFHLQKRDQEILKSQLLLLLIGGTKIWSQFRKTKELVDLVGYL